MGIRQSGVKNITLSFLIRKTSINARTRKAAFQPTYDRRDDTFG